MKEPHFDDQFVVQRAQQVVPLEKIRAGRRNRTILFLGSAFVLAMMLGAASALLTVRIKQHNQLTQINTDLAPETNASPETVAAAPVESPTEEPITEDVAPEPVKRVVAVKKEQPAVADRPRIVGARQDEIQPSEEEQLEQIREAVLYEQWQERRMRRAERRERRNRYRDRDLSRVDEIFEGPRRRDRP